MPLAAVLLTLPGVSPSLRAADAAGGSTPLSAFLAQNCIFCHSQKLKTAGVVLEGLDPSNPGAHAALLEKVLRKVRTGEMPPAGLPRPALAASKGFVTGLEDALDRAAAAHPDPGRPAIHRLNRAEYSNAIRDLLALDIQPGALLPVDDSGYGFDNVGAVLSVSPMLLERYLSVARTVARLAVGDPSTKPVEEEFPFPRTTRQRNERVSDDLPFDSAGGMAFRYDFPVDAEYVIRIKVGGDNGRVYEVRQPVPAGLRTIGVTFLRDSTKPEIPAPPAARRAADAPLAPPLPVTLDLRLDGARIKQFDLKQSNGGLPGLEKVVIAGPYNTSGSGDTPSRRRIFVCRPSTPAGEAPCAQRILATLGRRAFRRPVTDADIRPLLAFYETGRKEGGFDLGIEKALRAMLVSPDFLFRIERDPRGAAPGTVYRVSDFELASRLSFFLWSSIPDDELLDAAQKGKLKDAAVLQAEVRRMLADPRSQALVSNFGGQWLSLRNLALSKPDPVAFPEFDESLRDSFRSETELFFGYIVQEDRSLLDLLDADYTFLNQRLAQHYRIPDIYGSQLRLVKLSDPARGGLLGQGAILTITSYPNRTSVVQRGKWILEVLLGTPPPPPPPDVPEFTAQGKDGRKLTTREAMQQHRANAVCASCHSRMDPLGFALENYDGVGRWRAKDAGSTIDASGQFPDGTRFTGPEELKKALASARRDDFVDTAAEKLLLYALGRGLEGYDQPAVRAITRDAARDDFRFSALVAAIVKSTPFQMRRTPEP